MKRKYNTQKKIYRITLFFECYKIYDELLKNKHGDNLN